jgi:nucleoid-associated protein YgaU
LHFVAQVPSEVVLNRVWDAIKGVDATFTDLNHEITNTGGAEPSYTIASGDNLSKVSKLFYGNPNHYGKIAEASGISNPDHIQVGQVVTVPVLS